VCKDDRADASASVLFLNGTFEFIPQGFSEIDINDGRRVVLSECSWNLEDFLHRDKIHCRIGTGIKAFILQVLIEPVRRTGP